MKKHKHAKMEYEWGLPPDAQVTPDAYWGARAIFNKHKQIELLHDRQCFYPKNLEYPLLLMWLNSEALPWLRNECKKLDQSSGETVRLEHSPHTLIACPNSSYGYLYIGAWTKYTDEARYELQTPPKGLKWSGKDIPKRGDKVKINFNHLGTGRVLDYFQEHGFLGVRVLLDEQPDWHKKQNKGNPTAMVFGAEIKQIQQTQPEK